VARLFALCIYVADGYLTFIPEDGSGEQGQDGQRARQERDQLTRRFFRVLGELPLELQMMVCNRGFLSPKNLVLTKDSTVAFRMMWDPETWLREHHTGIV